MRTTVMGVVLGGALAAGIANGQDNAAAKTARGTPGAACVMQIGDRVCLTRRKRQMQGGWRAYGLVRQLAEQDTPYIAVGNARMGSIEHWGGTNTGGKGAKAGKGYIARVMIGCSGPVEWRQSGEPLLEMMGVELIGERAKAKPGAQYTMLAITHYGRDESERTVKEPQVWLMQPMIAVGRKSAGTWYGTDDTEYQLQAPNRSLVGGLASRLADAEVSGVEIRITVRGRREGAQRLWWAHDPEAAQALSAMRCEGRGTRSIEEGDAQG